MLGWKMAELDWRAKFIPDSRDFVVLVKPGRQMEEPTLKRSLISCCVIPTPLYVVRFSDLGMFRL